MRSGLDNESFENMDVRLQTYIYQRQIEKERQDRIIAQLDIAEAVNFAYIGSRSNKGAGEYRHWQLEKKRKAFGDERPVIWGQRKNRKTQKLT